MPSLFRLLPPRQEGQIVQFPEACACVDATFGTLR